MELSRRRCKQASTSNDHAVAQVWRNLWQAQVPTKIRHFGWKALHHGLRMREYIFRRGCDVERTCPMCEEENETILHALVLCPETKIVWKFSR